MRRVVHYRQKFLTVEEVLEKVRQQELICERMPELYGYRSSDISRHQRKLVSLASSLSVIFLQYDLYCESFNLLKVAAVTDLKLYAEGDQQASTWRNRVVVYCCLGFLFEK